MARARRPLSWRSCTAIVEAAALPLAGLTAWQALVETADVQPGQRVSPPAPACRAGLSPSRSRRRAVAYVIGTASAAKHDFLAELGVDEAIDDTAESVEERVSSVDLAIDLVGTEATGRAIASVRDGGLFIAITSASGVDPLREAAEDRIRVTPMHVEPDRMGLEAIAALVERGTAPAQHIAATFPLEDAAQAHELGETGRTQGKLVLTVSYGPLRPRSRCVRRRLVLGAGDWTARGGGSYRRGNRPPGRRRRRDPRQRRLQAIRVTSSGCARRSPPFPEPAVLVGYSMGGVVITQAAMHCRERIASLVFVLLLHCPRTASSCST